MLCRRYAAYTMLAGDTGMDFPEFHSSNKLAPQAMMQVDLALLSGCPYTLAEPVLAYACKQLQRSVSGVITNKPFNISAMAPKG